MVFVNLVDSDYVHLRLYQSGEIIDDYCNRPEIYNSYTPDENWLADWGDLTRDEFAALKTGHPERWSELLVDKDQIEAVEEAWLSQPVFSDDILLTTAKALDMNVDELWNVGLYPFDDTFTRFAFKLVQPRLYEI